MESDHLSGSEAGTSGDSTLSTSKLHHHGHGGQKRQLELSAQLSATQKELYGIKRDQQQLAAHRAKM